jgi:uncharacterized phage-associated protein
MPKRLGCCTGVSVILEAKPPMSNAHIELWKTGPVMKSTLNIGWTKDEYQRYRLQQKAKQKKKSKEKEEPISQDLLRNLLKLCDLLLEHETVTKNTLQTNLNMTYTQVFNLLGSAEKNGLLIWEGHNEVGELNAKEWKDKWKHLVV